MEEESLIPQEFFPEELEVPALSAQNTAHLMRYIYAYTKIKEKGEEFKQQQREVDAFYQNKQRQIESALTAIKGVIDAYMTYHNSTTIATPRGTAYTATRNKVEWNEEQALAWALAHEAEHPELVRTKKELDKDAYKKLWEAGTQVPGISSHQETSMVIKKA